MIVFSNSFLQRDNFMLLNIPSTAVDYNCKNSAMKKHRYAFTSNARISMLIFSHRGVQHQDFTKKNSHCFCLYKIHTQNNYVEQGKSCNIISLFCVKPKVICGKKLSSNLTRIYHFLLGLIGHGNFIECTYILGWFPKQRTFTRI